MPPATDPSATAPHCRLDCLLARDARKAVIFRRGPSKRTCLIAWDLGDDSFTVGQWFKGSVYPARSDLSADGEWLLVFMGSFRGPYLTWTVLSRPPWYTAVAFWPKGDTWGGGGRFLGRGEIVLRHPAPVLPAKGKVPRGFEVHASTPEREARLAAADAADPRAWRNLGETWRGPFRRRAGETTLTVSQPNIRDWDETRLYEVARGGRRLTLTGLDWADLDANGDLLFSRGGALHRLAQAHLAAAEDEGAVHAQARRLADFTALRPEARPAPYAPAREDGAEEVPAEPGYAPPLDRVSKADRRRRRAARPS